MGRGGKRYVPPFQVRAQDNLDDFAAMREQPLGSALVLNRPEKPIPGAEPPPAMAKRRRRRGPTTRFTEISAKFRAPETAGDVEPEMGETVGAEFLFVEAQNTGDGVSLRLAFGTQVEVANSPFSFQSTSLSWLDQNAWQFQGGNGDDEGDDRGSKEEQDTADLEHEQERVAFLEEALDGAGEGENVVEVPLDTPGDSLPVRAEDYHASQAALAKSDCLPRHCARIRTLGRTWQPGAVLVWRSFRLELRALPADEDRTRKPKIASQEGSATATHEPFGSAFELQVSRADSMVKAANKR
jgi:hypothetical protein